MCSYTGVGLFYKMQVSFGTLSMGYGPNSHMFPVVFGETGSFYTSVRTYHIAACFPGRTDLGLQNREHEIRVCRHCNAVQTYLIF